MESKLDSGNNVLENEGHDLHTLDDLCIVCSVHVISLMIYALALMVWIPRIAIFLITSLEIEHDCDKPVASHMPRIQMGYVGAMLS